MNSQDILKTYTSTQHSKEFCFTDVNLRYWTLVAKQLFVWWRGRFLFLFTGWREREEDQTAFRFRFTCCSKLFLSSPALFPSLFFMRKQQSLFLSVPDDHFPCRRWWWGGTKRLHSIFRPPFPFLHTDDSPSIERNDREGYTEKICVQYKLWCRKAFNSASKTTQVPFCVSRKEEEPLSFSHRDVCVCFSPSPLFSPLLVANSLGDFFFACESFIKMVPGMPLNCSDSSSNSSPRLSSPPFPSSVSQNSHTVRQGKRSLQTEAGGEILSPSSSSSRKSVRYFGLFFRSDSRFSLLSLWLWLIAHPKRHHYTLSSPWIIFLPLASCLLLVLPFFLASRQQQEVLSEMYWHERKDCEEMDNFSSRFASKGRNGTDGKEILKIAWQNLYIPSELCYSKLLVTSLLTASSEQWFVIQIIPLKNVCRYGKRNATSQRISIFTDWNDAWETC